MQESGFYGGVDLDILPGIVHIRLGGGLIRYVRLFECPNTSVAPRMSSRRKRVRFTLKALFAAMTLVAVVFALVAYPLRENYVAMNVVIFRHDGAFIPGKPDGPVRNIVSAGPKWLHRLVDQRCYLNIASLSFNAAEFGDEELSDVVPHLDTFSCFHALSLCGTSVSDDGVALLTELQQIDKLTLSQTDISDQALRHISRLSNLKELSLSGTRVTSAGIETLQEILPDCVIVKTD
ncbi:MAG: hypothetical protein HYV60_10305 [Planctomycetia bacterium]|nr:hypothetical protein [Planctomycetia bacterium]